MQDLASAVSSWIRGYLMPGDTQESSEFQKFDTVMRKILSVSKDELKKREKVWRRKRERAKKKRATS
jgi:hypothetical protein